MSEKKRDAAAIGDVLKNVFETLEAGQKLDRDQLEDCWKSLAGEAGAKHSRPSDLKKSVLVVRVDSPVWMQEFAMKKRSLLKGLQRTLGKDRISEIQFKIGEF